jgi:serine/threonine-protein kinase
MRGGLDTDAVVDERYQVVAHVGSGGMAEVYCAIDLQLGRKVALKVLHERFAADEEFVERFKREASSAAGLQHQHLVAVYDRGEWDGTSYIAMEYVAGQTLKQIVTEEGWLPAARAVDLTVQILRGARFAHRRGVIHRDFKPQNVIVDDEGRAKVTDFGIARAGASDMTQTGSIMGTAQYLSPEQAQGHAVTARSDLYSIGIILYELLTGKVPFEADSAVTIALKQVNEAPVAPSQINPAVTPELEAVVLRALMKDPRERFADADEFIAALEAAASRIPSPAAIAAAEAAAAAMPGAAAIGGGLLAPPPAAPPLTGVYSGQPPPYEQREPVVVAPPPADPRRPRKRWPWLLLGALALVGLVLLLVSALSPERVQVPNVVNSTISVATQRLRNEGFEVVPVRDNSDRPRNTVIGQDPEGETTADKGSRVTITVSDGPSITEVPDVIGDTRMDAHRALREAGFGVDEKRVASDKVRIDRVVAQTPDGGLFERGKAVTIEVSSGPERLPVPDVTGKSEDEARAALEAFRVVVQEKEDGDAEPGTVLAQKPTSGKLPRGSTVTLAIAIEPKRISVPNVVGRSQNLATNLLSARGFEVTVEEVDVDTPNQDGLVQKQSPGPDDDKVERGATVTITVGRFDPALNPEPGTQTPTTPGATTTTPAP